jgi:hypothetical protein
LKRSATEAAQDYYEGGATLAVPNGARFFFHVYLDPADPPRQ